MADAVSITVTARDPAKNKGTGTRVARKLRAQGQIPAIVYGHKQAPQPISIGRDDVWKMIKKATHLAQLQIGTASEMVVVRDIQWDHLGKEILHLDFARVSADERIETEVKVETHGTAPGVAEGGALDQPVHTLTVSCRATAIPESIRVDLSDLHMNKAIYVRELTLPEGVTTAMDPDAVVVHVINRYAEAEPVAADVVQPELIRKPEAKKDAE